MIIFLWKHETIWKKFLKILAPFCPHIAEELWKGKSIFLESWPKYDEKLIKKEIFELVIQVNGKVRGKVEVRANISEDEAKKLALSDNRTSKWLVNKKPKKVIYVKGRLVNIVI